MGINDVSKVTGGVRPEAAGATEEVAKPIIRDQEPSSAVVGVQRPEDMTRTTGAESVGAALPTSGTPAARTVDIVKLTERVGRGTMEVRLHLTPGTKLAKARVPEGMYAVIELATKQNGEVDFDASSMHFENAKGDKVVLDRKRSMFDVRGADFSRDGAIEVDIVMSPFDVDVTQKLAGVNKLPKQLSELVAVLTGRVQSRAGSGAARGIIDRTDVSYKGFFEARAGTIELAGRSSIELHENANMFVMGNAAAGMLQINTPENGASLNLESADGSVFRTAPSTLNVRIGFKAERNTRFLMFHDSTLNDVTMTVNIDGTPLTVKVGQFNLDGNEAVKVSVDPRWVALEAQAATGGTTVPPSEANGSDVEMTVVRKFLEKWPLSDIAGSKPEKIAQLLQDPHNTDIHGFYGLFEGSIVNGVAEGLELVPYFIRERMQAMPRAELAVIVQRAYLANLLVRHDEADEEDSDGAGPTKEDLADRYHREVRQLADMYGELLTNTTDETRRGEIEAALSRFARDSRGGVADRDPGRDLAMINTVGEDLRPDPEMPAYDAFAYLFERDGSLDDNLRNTIMPALAEKLAGRLPESGEISVERLSLKPGIQPMAFMALSHPMVKQAMRDPKVRALANEARGSVEVLIEGFMMRRLQDAEPKVQEKAVRGALAAQQGVEPDQISGEAIAAVLANPAQRQAVFDQLGQLGVGKFNQGRDGLRNLFMRVGGMEPNGKAEAFINMVIDEVLKTDGIPADKKQALEAQREKLVAMAVNTARAAIWIRMQPNYREWPQIGTELMAQVNQTDAERSALGSEQWLSELEALTGTQAVAGNSIESLVDGPAFFQGVKDLIDATPQPGPIYVNYWAIYDDTSGKEFTDLLIAKKTEGYDIQVVVDGKTAMDTGLGKKESLPALQAAGIPVTIWNDPAQPPVGIHIKYIATPAGVVTGGSNIGDEYTHAGEPEHKWSDTNVRISGPATQTFLALHESILQQAGVSVTRPARAASTPAADAAGNVLLIHEKPGDLEHPILLATMKMLEGTGAGETVRIKNAYFVMTAPIRMAIDRAVRRGVNIEIFTNSPMSIDEPTIAIPIMDSVRDALRVAERARAEVGDSAGVVKIWMPHIDLQNPAQSDHNTVHDKLSLAGNVSAVMTYNFHPRSETLENEIATIVVDDTTMEAQLVRWNDSTASATAITSSEHPLFSSHQLGYTDVVLELFKNLF